MAAPTIEPRYEQPLYEQFDPAGGSRVGLGLAIVASVLAVIGARAVNWRDVDGYGLISALPPIYWLAVVVALVATFMLYRVAQDSESRFAAAVPMMWLVILHTAPQLAHRHVRFPIVWTHIGFVRAIDETGSSPVNLDARFAWPGLFGAFVAPLHDMPQPVLEVLMRFWPTYITGGTAILVASLARRSYPAIPLIGSLSALAYVFLAWTGQDYFSPQSVSYLIYMAVLVILESGPLRVNPAWSQALPFLSRFATAGGDRPAARSTAAFVALSVLCLGAVVSHPLGPFFICMGLVILGLYGRRTAWRLLIVVGAAYLLWFLVSAQPFWQSRIEELFGNVGQVNDVVGKNTAERIARGSAERGIVTSVRSIVGLSTFLFVLGYGVAMATERLKFLRPALPLAPLAGIPALAVALQSYGGEIIIRVMLFTLPMASILVGRMLASVQTKWLSPLLVVITAFLMPVFFLARFGNESFEMSVGPDRSAIEAAYAAAAAYTPANDKTLFVGDNPFIPWRDEDVGRNAFIEQPYGGHRDFDECGILQAEQIRIESGTEQVLYVLTNSQQNWAIQGQSKAPSYNEQSAQWLLSRPGSELVYEKDGAWVIRVDTTNVVLEEVDESCSWLPSSS